MRQQTGSYNPRVAQPRVSQDERRTAGEPDPPNVLTAFSPEHQIPWPGTTRAGTAIPGAIAPTGEPPISTRRCATCRERSPRFSAAAAVAAVAAMAARPDAGTRPCAASASARSALVLLAVWAATGLYKVDAAERAVVTRFGKYVATTEPGLRWHLPWPIEARQIVNVESVEGFSDQTRMLTSDENLVDINIAVQYRRAEPVAFVFNVRDPEATLERGERERDPRDRRPQHARLRARGRAGRRSPRRPANSCSARSTRTRRASRSPRSTCRA